MRAPLGYGAITRAGDRRKDGRFMEAGVPCYVVQVTREYHIPKGWYEVKTGKVKRTDKALSLVRWCWSYTRSLVGKDVTDFVIIRKGRV